MVQKIFISYRRDDSADVAGRIYDKLVEQFGRENIFMDVDSIPLGIDFRKAVTDEVEKCDIQLVVIGKHWLDISDQDNNRRLDNAGDFVRVEIEAALNRGIRVIPLLVGGAKVPSESALPPSIAAIAHRNGIDIRRNPDFHTDMDRLITKITDTFQPKDSPIPKPKTINTQSEESKSEPFIVPKVLRITPEQDRLLKVMLDPSEPPEVRAQAGREINQWGDPRPGVLDLDFEDGYWCAVPASTFFFQNDDEETVVPSFSIGKYPITFKQFQEFIDDSDGYSNAYWWKDLHISSIKLRSAGALEQSFKYNNHPRDSVSWYEAMAFCAWLSSNKNQEIRLPTEQEWEKAARGLTDHIFPWGNTYMPGYANVNEIAYYSELHYLQSTTAVGIYSQGQSQYGVLDLSGNVWEWMLNEYKPTGNQKSKLPRSLRGGSWGSSVHDAQTKRRYSSVPNERIGYFGFRVVKVG